MKLYELPLAFRELDAMLTESEGEITPEIHTLMQTLDTTLEAKVDGIGALVAEAKAEAEAFREEKDRLAARQKTAENRAETLKNYLFVTLDKIGKTKVKGSRFTASCREAGVPSIRWDMMEGEIPEPFRRVVTTLDGVKAQEAYKAGTLPKGFVATKAKYLVLS